MKTITYDFESLTKTVTINIDSIISSTVHNFSSTEEMWLDVIKYTLTKKHKISEVIMKTKLKKERS